MENKGFVITIIAIIAVAFFVNQFQTSPDDYSGQAARLRPRQTAVLGNLSKAPLPGVNVTKRVFVTHINFYGNLNGLNGADQKCRDVARSANLSGNWVAWLSDSNVNAGNRIPNVRYVRLDGVKVADNKNDLLDGTLDNPINVDENGRRHDNITWTGTNSAGLSTGFNCINWFSSSFAHNGTVGINTNTSGAWTNFGLKECFLSFGLYCFEK